MAQSSSSSNFGELVLVVGDDHAHHTASSSFNIPADFLNLLQANTGLSTTVCTTRLPPIPLTPTVHTCCPYGASSSSSSSSSLLLSDDSLVFTVGTERPWRIGVTSMTEPFSAVRWQRQLADCDVLISGDNNNNNNNGEAKHVVTKDKWCWIRPGSITGSPTHNDSIPSFCLLSFPPTDPDLVVCFVYEWKYPAINNNNTNNNNETTTVTQEQQQQQQEEEADNDDNDKEDHKEEKEETKPTTVEKKKTLQVTKTEFRRPSQTVAADNQRLQALLQ